MVLIKACLQNVVRRFTAATGISLIDLKTKLKDLFPELAPVSREDINLYYRDPDNDLVTVSSDEELRVAENGIGSDQTLKVILNVAEQEEEEEEDLSDIVGSFFPSHSPHSIFGHAHSMFPSHSSIFGSDPISFPSLPTWSDRMRMMERHEERLRRQRLYEEGMRKAHLESLKKLKEKAEEERKVAEEKGGVTGGEIQRRSSKEFKPVMPVFPPGWQVSPFGTWEPVTYQTPYGSRRVLGPWGYRACYGDDKMDTEDKKETKEEKTEEVPTEEVPTEEVPTEEVPKEDKMEETPKEEAA